MFHVKHHLTCTARIEGGEVVILLTPTWTWVFKLIWIALTHDQVQLTVSRNDR